MGRDAIPAEVKRAVLVEAGHRCAISTCRATTTEIAHIEPWAETKDHSFDNLIALCPNCHTRYDANKEIDRKSMRMYKEALKTSRQTFAETVFLGDQDSELEVPENWGPVLTIHCWMYDCTVDRLVLRTKKNAGPWLCATILDIQIDGESVFEGHGISITTGADTSETSSIPFTLAVPDWNGGSRIQFQYAQIGGGVGYQLLISGVKR